MEIRESRDSDEEGIRSLFRASFDKDLSHEEFIWKYRNSYLGSSSSIAIEDDRVVAHYGGFRLCFYSRGETFNAFQGCDVMTHPGYRAKIFARKGIIVRTAEEFYRANPMEFIYGFPPERHARLMTLQLGFEQPRFVNVMKKLKKDFRPFSGVFWKIISGWDHIRPAEIDSLWIKMRDSCGLTIDKDSRYILWRYRDNPRGTYEIIAARGKISGRLKAYAVIKEEEGVLYILDLFVTEEADIKKMIGALERIASQRGHTIICLWVNPAESLHREFTKAGYSSEEGIRYIVRMFKGARFSADFFLERYAYRMGDYDAV